MFKTVSYSTFTWTNRYLLHQYRYLGAFAGQTTLLHHADICPMPLLSLLCVECWHFTLPLYQCVLFLTHFLSLFSRRPIRFAPGPLSAARGDKHRNHDNHWGGRASLWDTCLGFCIPIVLIQPPLFLCQPFLLSLQSILHPHWYWDTQDRWKQCGSSTV